MTPALPMAIAGREERIGCRGGRLFRSKKGGVSEETIETPSSHDDYY
ncbi:MAG TPA: hypothetical protein VNQ80_17260 [Parapedobacter sp.]|nr:hypothetical protein [Parapedobacter sp.]HWK59097.1 hypothetical protein [Parapedobacter sp.]